MANGLLAGLVAVTAPCGNINPYAAIIIGIIGALSYLLCSFIVS